MTTVERDPVPANNQRVHLEAGLRTAPTPVLLSSDRCFRILFGFSSYSQ